MGKVVKFTGSRLLGEELRRLRGGRSLDDVVALGKSKLMQYGFKGVAKASLSEIENGISLPNIESMFALSILYQVPTSRFLHVLLEENLISDVEAPAAPDALREAFADAVEHGRLTEALALATHALRRAAPGWETLRWRLNRAAAIEQLGMRWDALAEVQEALDHPDLPRTHRYLVHRELARMHTTAGQFSLAELHAERALALAPPTLSAAERSALLRAHVRLVIARCVWGLHVSDEDVALADSRLSEAARLAVDAPASDRLVILLYRAQLAIRRSDRRTARSLLENVVTQARVAELPDRQVEALYELAGLERDEEAARRRLSLAADVATENNYIEKAFLCYYRLGQLATSEEQRALFARKCRRLYPLVRSSHPHVRAFERDTRSGRT